MKKVFLLVIAILVAFAAYSAQPQAASGNAKGPADGMTIEAFKTTDLDGNDLDSSIFKNAQLTVINYWATWCPPCRMEMPDFSKLHKHFSDAHDSSVQVLGVICEGNGCTPASAKQYLNENGFEWNNIRSTAQLDKVFYTSNSIPQTLIVDQGGKVLAHKIGAFTSYDELYNYVSSFAGSNGDADTGESTASAQSTDAPTARPKASSCGGF